MMDCNLVDIREVTRVEQQTGALEHTEASSRCPTP